MKNIIVIYHKADFDGIFSREIARRHFGDRADYIGWDYGDPVPEIPAGLELYMIDISVDGLMDYTGLVWIDHHVSAMKKFSPDTRGIRIDGVAACRLAWQYFMTANRCRNPMLDQAIGFFPSKQDFVDRKVSEPYAVRLAGEYDIWDKRDPNTDVFQSGLRSLDLTNQWAQLFRQDKPKISEIEALADCGHKHDIIQPDGTVWPPIIYTILANGRVLEYANAESNASLMADVSFELDWEGLRFLAINKPRGNSRTFAAGVKPEHDALLTFYWCRDKWRVSLYHAPHRTDLDLSTIAVKFGGGGHRGACGFECKALPFFPEPNAEDKARLDWMALHVGNVDFHINAPPDILCTNPWISTGQNLRGAIDKASAELP